MVNTTYDWARGSPAVRWLRQRLSTNWWNGWPPVAHNTVSNACFIHCVGHCIELYICMYIHTWDGAEGMGGRKSLNNIYMFALFHTFFLSPPLSSPHFPPSSDMQFVKTFLLSYQSFTTPLRLLGKLVERYNVVRPEGMPLQEFRALRITIQVRTYPCTQGSRASAWCILVCLSRILACFVSFTAAWSSPSSTKCTHSVSNFSDVRTSMRINPLNTHFNPLNTQFPLYVRTNSGDGMVCDVFVHTYSMYHYAHIVYMLCTY